MAKVTITEQYLEDIADAIRSKSSSSTTYTPSQMAAAILAIPTGSTINNQNKAVTPNETEQSITFDSGYTGLGTVTVSAISSTYVGSGITRRSSTDLTASGKTITVPAGFYETQATKDVASGVVTAPNTIVGGSATIRTGTNTITFLKTVSVIPLVTTAGYVSSGTAGDCTVELSANIITKAATTYHPSTSSQSIASSTYLTGAQTIAAVTTSNLSASNIVSGVTIKVGDSSDDDCVASVTGNVVLQNYYTGSSAPSSSLGQNGDLYLQV